MKTKLIALALTTLCLLLGLASCGGGTDTTTTASVTEPAPLEVKLNGKALSDYKVIFVDGSTKAEEAAGRLASEISARYGIELPVESSASEKSAAEIVVGICSRSTGLSTSLDKCGYGTVDGRICTVGSHSSSYERSVDMILEDIAAAVGDKTSGTVEVALDSRDDEVSVTTLKVMSFNIRFDAYNQKGPAVAGVINKYAPDIIGIQEATGGWMTQLKARIGKTYDFVYAGREKLNDTKGEGTPVFYNKEKFELVSSGTKWLGPDSDRPVITPGAKKLRIFTYVELNVRETGERIVFVSTHLDHGGDDIAVVQAGYLKQYLHDIFGADTPFIIVGDFNTVEDTKTYAAMTSEAGFGLENASNNKEFKDTNGTYGEQEKKIDYCYYNSDYAKFKSYKVIEDKTDDEFPSDHRPLLVELYLK